MMASRKRKRANQHECKTYQDGDWLVYYCTTCKDYEKRLNRKTGEIITRHTRTKNQTT